MSLRTLVGPLICLQVLLLRPGNVVAQEEEGGATVGMAAEFVSQYVWRGLEQIDKPSLQPDVWVEFGALSVGVWGSFALNGDFNEVDYYVSWYSELPVGELTLTWQDYYYPDAEGDFGDFLNFSGGGDGAHTVEIIGEFSLAAAPLTFTAGWNAINDPDHALYGAVSGDVSLPAFDISGEIAMLLNDSPEYYGGDAGNVMYYGATVTRGLPSVGAYSPYLSASVVRSRLEERTFWVFALGF